MTVGELRKALENIDQSRPVFMGYDGNIVVTPACEVEELLQENQLDSCWYSVHLPAVVILCGD